MAVDIGAEAINRASYGGALQTRINKDKPAEIAGIITSIDIWAKDNITGFRVGTFYVVSGDTLKCRASEAIAGTITAGSKVVKAVSITVEIGDYIGFYCSVGSVEMDTSGYAGCWTVEAEQIDPNDEAEYTFWSRRALSLGGYIAVPGWQGKISGVTNPAKIMGVDVANIAKVKGVA